MRSQIAMVTQVSSLMGVLVSPQWNAWLWEEDTYNTYKELHALYKRWMLFTELYINMALTLITATK